MGNRDRTAGRARGGPSDGEAVAIDGPETCDQVISGVSRKLKAWNPKHLPPGRLRQRADQKASYLAVNIMSPLVILVKAPLAGVAARL